jgi:hypothetical protein
MQLLSDCDFDVIVPSGIKLSVNMAIVIMQRCIELSIILSFIMLSGIMLNVIMLSVIIFSEIMREALC